MFIYSIKICNLFAYYGEVEVDFTQKLNENLYLIYGNNGYGKTSFIRCAKILFNGIKLDDEFDENFTRKITKIKDKLPFNAFMRGKNPIWRGILNESALNERKENYFIEFNGKINDERFCIKRTWEVFLNEIKEHLYFKKGDKEYYQIDAQYEIDKILPKEFIDFFFFDGEDIKTMALDLRTNLREKMEEILCIAPLKELIKASENLQKELKIQEMNDETTKNQEKEIERNIESKKEKLHLNEKYIADFEEQMQETQETIDDIEKEIRKIYIQTNTQSKELEIQRQSLQNNLTINKDEILKNLQTIFVSNTALIKQIESTMQNIESKSNKSDIEALKRLMPEIKDEAKGFDVDFIAFLENLPQKLQEKVLGDCPMPLDLFEGIKRNISEYKRLDIHATLQKIIQYKKDLMFNKKERDNLHSHDEYTKQKLESLEQEKAQKQESNDKFVAKIKELKELNITFKNEIDSLAKEQQRLLSNITTERIAWKLEILKVISSNIKEYTNKLLEKLKESLKDRILQNYKSIIANDNIESLKIEDDFAMSFYDKNDNEISIGNQSEGQKQILAISIFWAISSIAEKKMPLIIDTPLARIDKENRTNIITNYYKNASSQIILLPTNTEITHSEFAFIKDFVAQIYQITNKNDRGHAQIYKAEITTILGENNG